MDVRQQIVGVTPDWLESNITSVGSDSSGNGAPVRSHRRQDEIVAWVTQNAPRGQWLALGVCAAEAQMKSSAGDVSALRLDAYQLHTLPA
jgi:hypothetical protein